MEGRTWPRLTLERCCRRFLHRAGASHFGYSGEMEARGAGEKWLVSRPGHFVVFAQCEIFAAVDPVESNTATIDYHSPTGTGPTRITIDIIRTTGGTEWAVRITWAGAGQVDYLDESGACRGCGRPIVDARVNDAGRILVWHAE